MNTAVTDELNTIRNCLTTLLDQVGRLQHRIDTNELNTHSRTLPVEAIPLQPPRPIPAPRHTGVLLTPQNHTDPPQLRDTVQRPQTRRHEQIESHIRGDSTRENRQWPALPPPRDPSMHGGRQRETYNNHTNNTAQRSRDNTDTLAHKLFQIAQINRAAATWKTLPSRLAEKIDEFELLLTPPMPDEQFKEEKKRLLDNMRNNITKLVNDHLVRQKENKKQELGRMKNCTREGVERARITAENKLNSRYNGKISTHHTRRSLDEATAAIGRLQTPIQNNTDTVAVGEANIPTQNRFSVLSEEEVENNEGLQGMETDTIDIPRAEDITRGRGVTHTENNDRPSTQMRVQTDPVPNPSPVQPDRDTGSLIPRNTQPPPLTTSPHQQTHNNDNTGDTALTSSEQETRPPSPTNTGSHLLLGGSLHRTPPSTPQRTQRHLPTRTEVEQTPRRGEKRGQESMSVTTTEIHPTPANNTHKTATETTSISPPIVQEEKKQRTTRTVATEPQFHEEIDDEQLFTISNIITVANDAATAIVTTQSSPVTVPETRYPTAQDFSPFRKTLIDDFKKLDSKIKPKGDKPILMISDSQMRHATGFPGNVELIVGGGMNLQHVYTLLGNSDLHKLDKVQDIVVHVGINNRTWQTTSNYSEVSKLFVNLKKTKKAYHIVGVSIPPNLSPEHEERLHHLNQELRRKVQKEGGHFIEPLPTEQVRVSLSDPYGIHYDTATLRRLCDMIICSFPRTRPSPRP